MTQQISLVERVGNCLELKSLALIGNLDCKPFGAFGDKNVNFLVSVVPVPVNHGIHHAFPESHSDAVLLVFVEPGLSSCFQSGSLRHIDALQRGGVVLVEYCLFADVHCFQIRATLTKSRTSAIVDETLP